MLYVYCSQPSDGARDLTIELEGTRLRRFDGLEFWRKNKRIAFKPEDVLICWGSPVPDEFDEIKVLNKHKAFPKQKELRKFIEAKIRTVTLFDGNIHYLAHPTDPNWIGRKSSHIGGNDILAPTGKPDYYVKRENLVEEYRIHCFAGKSIRAGIKVHREGFEEPHEWVRSYDAGWRIKYDGFRSTKAMRELAKKSVDALGLAFGAVDLGKRSDGHLMVLEVNRAPGIEGNTIKAYGEAIRKWMDGSDTEEEDAE